MGNESSNSNKQGSALQRPNSTIIKTDLSQGKPEKSVTKSFYSFKSVTRSANTQNASTFTNRSYLSPNGKDFSKSHEESSINSTFDPHKIRSNAKKNTVKKVINNGVTGQYLTVSMAETAYVFWQKNIESMSTEDKLEIGCSIYFTMMGSSPEMKRILKINGKGKIEQLSLQFLDMMDWLIRHLLVNHINLSATLTQLGSGHKAMGINIQHLGTMLQAVHESFGYYFEHKYSIEERYAIDKLFTVASRLMTGQDLHNVKIMDNFSKSFSDLKFLVSLDKCLQSETGREYIYRFFQQTFCDELVIYLQWMRKYNAAMSDKERFMIARTICKTCIVPTAAFTINISFEQRTATLGHMCELEKQFKSMSTDEFKVPIDLFEKVYLETVRLIQQNHWKKFVNNIEKLKNDCTSPAV